MINTSLAAAVGASLSSAHAEGKGEWKSLFDGKTLGGWNKAPRIVVNGGGFTNGLGSYLAAPFFVDGDMGEDFKVENLREGKIPSNFPNAKVSNAATYAQFREVWNVNDWNRFRVRCVGANPVLTVWINDLGPRSTPATPPPSSSRALTASATSVSRIMATVPTMVGASGPRGR